MRQSTDYNSGRFTTLPLAAARRIDAICNQFEAEWQNGRAPEIESYDDDLTGQENQGLLRELLLVELSHLRKGGEQPHVSNYQKRFPAVAE